MQASTLESDQLKAILLRGQRSVLELIAAGTTLPQVLASLCVSVEEICAGTLCSVLLLTEDGGHLRHGAAPNLPADYCRLIDGIAIGPAIGSCGTAAFTRKPVLVTDIATDPLWRGFERLALAAGLASCASTPIFARPGERLLGTFAIYHRHAGAYSPLELQVLQSISDLAAIAILNHQREEALRASETRRARTAALSHVIEAEVALDGRWLRAPGALCALLGRTEEELLTLRIQELLHASDLEADQGQMQRLLRGELDAFETESRLVRRDGGTIWAVLNYSPVRDGDGRPLRLAVYITDVTPRKHAEEALRAAQRVEAIALLAPGLAHDLNNLLTAVLCNASLGQSVVSASSEAGQALEAIETITRRAADLTRQLGYAGRKRPARQSIDVNQLAKEVTQTLSASFPRNVRLELDLSAPLPSVSGDPSQIHQVVMNLVINAAQAIGQNAGLLRVRTSATELHDDDLGARFADQRLAPGAYVLLEVSDTGAGMDPETIRKIFDPFFTTKPTGRGVGLAVARGIVSEHRAGLEVESAIGVGSTFRVYLPAAPARSIRPSALNGETYWPGAHGIVLVVDESPAIRTAVARMLHSLGFEALEAADGPEAFLLLAKRRNDVSLVLFDVTSPRAGGPEALSLLNERWPDLKVILTVGSEGADISAYAQEMRILQKPYNLVDLKRAMSGEPGSGLRSGMSSEGVTRSA